MTNDETQSRPIQLPTGVDHRHARLFAAWIAGTALALAASFACSKWASSYAPIRHYPCDVRTPHMAFTVQGWAYRAALLAGVSATAGIVVARGRRWWFVAGLVASVVAFVVAFFAVGGWASGCPG
jgi:hypothetical protein